MIFGAGEMAQWLKVFIAISESPVSSLNTNIVVHNHQTAVQDIQHLFLSYKVTNHTVVKSHLCRQKIYAHKIKKSFKYILMSNSLGFENLLSRNPRG